MNSGSDIRLLVFDNIENVVYLIEVAVPLDKNIKKLKTKYEQMYENLLKH
jgi:hypothetical protein